MSASTSQQLLELRAKLLGSYLLYCQVFYPIVTGREFLISNPVGRESHFITIGKELTSILRLETFDTLVNVAPGSGKSTMLAFWVSWCYARFPDCNFLYISYAHDLATKHTTSIRTIMQTKLYRDLFNVHLKTDSKAKDHFVTEQGGTVSAFGSAGAITGRDAGLPACDRFSGAVIIDDAHKPDEVHSETIRHKVIQNYKETILQRPRSPSVPIIFVGQRLHEDDLPAFLMSEDSERKFRLVILKSIDDAGNALYPEVHPLEMLKEKAAKNEYVYASQFNQDPIPSGGALYKENDFVMLEEEPKFLVTFITADTAETDKSYNDSTVFHFFGLYRVSENAASTETYALHSIKCWEIRVEPRELEYEFRSFIAECMNHDMPPRLAAIEKKSTGVTLLSILNDLRGLELREVKRTKASGSKTSRYLEMQPIIASKLLSFTKGAPHAKLCINQMIRITANDTHKHDDICDTIYDAVKIALLSKTLVFDVKDDTKPENDMALLEAKRAQQALNNLYG